MNLHVAALVGAGVIGGGVAVMHGVLVQRLMVRPLAASGRLKGQGARLVPLLLQFSTYNWLLSGLALIAAALWLGREARLAVALMAGSSFLFGGLGNLWGTRRLHPGWVLYGLAVGLIGFGLT